jgi:hypothetical protein
MSEDPRPPRHGPRQRRPAPPARLPHQASLDRAVQAQIGAQLRTMYEHYVEQAIPERLIDLVHRLGEPRDSGRGTGPPSDRRTRPARPHGRPDRAGGRRPAGPQADPRSAGEEA